MQAAAMKCATEYSNTQTCGPAGKCEMQDIVVEGSTETASMCTMSKAEQQRLTAQALDEAVKAAKPAAFNGSVSFYQSTDCTGAAKSTAGAVDVTGTCKLDEGTWDKHHSSTGNKCTTDTTLHVFSGFSTEALCNDTMALADKATMTLKADGECNQITADGSTFSYKLSCGSAKPAITTAATAGGAKDPAANATKPATNTAAKTTAATATVTIPADGNLATMSAADIAVLVTQFEATVKAACAADAAAAACTGQ